MAVFIGTDGFDSRRGGDAADQFDGRGGDDRLSGGRGGDTLLGETGNDLLRGGDGADTLDGGEGNDVLMGHADFDSASNAYWMRPTSGSIDATRVAVRLQQTVFGDAPDGDTDHLFIAEIHTGKIKILNLANNTIAATPFLDLDDARISQSPEQGLVGFAFDPDYATNGHVYVSVLDPEGDTQILRFTRSATDPLRLDPASETLIWDFPRNQPHTNHTGGWIDFGPDGYLYLTSGDGGPGADRANFAQNTNSLLGKILRIDVNGGDDFPDDPLRNYAIPSDNPYAGGGGAPEVWAIGLRHPWRASFDRETGDFYIGDVGQAAFEEVDFQAAGAPGGANYGWAVMEGNAPYDPDRPGNPVPGDPVLVAPVIDYDHDYGESVTGGYVYRGPSAGMEGFYIFADFTSDRFGTFRVENGIAVDRTDITDRIVANVAALRGISSFAEDAAGNLYSIGYNGQIYRLDPTPGAADGDDVLRGGNGNDSLYGGPGSDRLFGDADDDRLSGGWGADVLAGGAGTDLLFGDGGDDRLVGGGGDDDIRGGDGIDTLVRAPGEGIDRFLDFTAADRVDLTAYGFADADEALTHARNLGNGNVLFEFSPGDRLVLARTTVAALEAVLII